MIWDKEILYHVGPSNSLPHTIFHRKLPWPALLESRDREPDSSRVLEGAWPPAIQESLPAPGGRSFAQGPPAIGQWPPRAPTGALPGCGLQPSPGTLQPAQWVKSGSKLSMCTLKQMKGLHMKHKSSSDTHFWKSNFHVAMYTSQKVQICRGTVLSELQGRGILIAIIDVYLLY